MQDECRKWVWQLSSRVPAVISAQYYVYVHQVSNKAHEPLSTTSMNHKRRVDCYPSKFTAWSSVLLLSLSAWHFVNQTANVQNAST